MADNAGAVIIEGPPAATPQGQPLPLAANLAEVLDAQIVALVRHQPDLQIEESIAPLKALGDRLLGRGPKRRTPLSAATPPSRPSYPL